MARPGADRYGGCVQGAGSVARAPRTGEESHRWRGSLVAGCPRCPRLPVLARWEQEALTAYDLADGRQLWRQAYDAPYRMNPAATSHGKGPKATPQAPLA